MKKTRITIVPPDDLYADENIPMDTLFKLFSKVGPLADALEKGLELDEGYRLTWIVEWVGHCDNPPSPTISATVRLCRSEQAMLDAPKTSPVLVSVIESAPILITEKRVSFLNSSGVNVMGDIEDFTPEEIISGIRELMQRLQPEQCTALYC